MKGEKEVRETFGKHIEGEDDWKGKVIVLLSASLDLIDRLTHQWKRVS